MGPSLRHSAAILRAARRARIWPTSGGAYLVSSASARRRQSTTTSHPPPSSSSSYSSVDPSEIAHFDALASSWWDPHGPSRLLHLMNPLRHDFIRACHASQPDPNPPPDKLRYLDVGCGGGIFAESAARLPTTASVTAIDPSAAVLAVAAAHARRDPALHPATSPGRLTYVRASVETLPEEDQQQFDVVSLFEVVEHVDAPAAFLERCGQFVRPGGWLVLSTIARTWASWATTKLLAEDVLRIVPRGTHDWWRYINEEELSSYFLGKPGWGSPRCMGVVYVPGLGWREVAGSEKIGNYFFGVRKDVL